MGNGDGGRTGTFDFKGRSLTVTHHDALWGVDVDGEHAESRRLDEALAALIGSSRETTKLAVDVLEWSMT
jgi:hypothetical protein